MEKYILTDTVNGVHVSKDLLEVLTKAEDDVKNGRVAAIGKTFTELRNMLQENQVPIMATDDNVADGKSDKSIWQLLNIRCTSGWQFLFFLHSPLWHEPYQ